MVPIGGIDPNDLSRAVLAWTGYQSAVCPTRDESAVANIFSHEKVAKLMVVIASLEDDFYESKAYLTAANLEEMGNVATKEFTRRHPGLPIEIAEAFAWCYTFDYK